MARPESTDSSGADAARWIMIAIGVAAAATATRYLIRTSRRGEGMSQPVSTAFTINRPPEEVAQLWNEIDPLGDIVEHVRFDVAPGDRGTEVRVQFHPRWFGRRGPARVRELLRRFKQVAETSEVARSTYIGAGRTC